MSVSEYPPPALAIPMQRTRGVALDSRQKERRRLSMGENEEAVGSSVTAPMFYMLGSFYSFIWVGTPPQRVSVIVDTGSHNTAFPCVGCRCGKHMDPHFDPHKSSTSQVLKCLGGGKCFFRQSYSEGSSWHAFKVRDRVWVGGENTSAVAKGLDFSTEFDFGCQDSETGLFRTQSVDGIMGMSGAEDTLPYVLAANKVTKSKVFAICFRLGGGVLTLGGLDPTFHLPGLNMQFAKLFKASGWYTVKLLDVLMRHPKTGEVKSIGAPVGKYNTGKGAIVDSGTTDTYLPSSVQFLFMELFQRMSSGMTYNNYNLDMSKKQLANLPTIIYRIQDVDGNHLDVESPPNHYTEAVPIRGKTKHAFRIYLTEPSGTVLGANFMLGYNVLFDMEGQKVGFAKSKCILTLPPAKKTTEVAASHVAAPLSVPSAAVSEVDFVSAALLREQENCKEVRFSLFSRCNASCESTQPRASYLRVNVSTNEAQVLLAKATGYQFWRNDPCNGNNRSSSSQYHDMSSDIVKEPCTISCNRGLIVSGQNPFCSSNEPWSLCSESCSQQRIVGATPLAPKNETCIKTLETRKCRVFECPAEDGDLAVTINFQIEEMVKAHWSYVHQESLFRALSILFQIPESNFHLFQGPMTIGGTSLKLQVKLRLSITNQRDSSSKESLQEFATTIVRTANHKTFPLILSRLVNGNSSSGNNFGWLPPHNLLVGKVFQQTIKIPGAKSKSNSGLWQENSEEMNSVPVDGTLIDSESVWLAELDSDNLLLVCIVIMALFIIFLLRRPQQIVIARGAAATIQHQRRSSIQTIQRSVKGKR